MAGTPERLIADRAALLLRCQQARERRRRIEAARAANLRVAAAEALSNAQAALAAHERARHDEMRRRYDAMAGRRVDAATLQALPADERLWRRRAAAHAETCKAEERRRLDAEAAETLALQALARAARSTLRRERLAATAMHRHQCGVDIAEEALREDAILETWRAVS